MALTFGCCPAFAAPLPNFVFVFCDNLGYGDIEPFGSALHRTPHLARMAREGTKFTHFYVSAGVCTPSRASLLTGCYAQRVGMHTNERDGLVLRPVSPYGLHPDEVTIAEVLRARGYATAIIGKWHLGDQPEFLPTRQGFETFFGIPYSDDMTERTWEKDGSQWPPLPLMEGERVICAPCERSELTKRYTERALAWIDEHQSEPFFLYWPQAMPGSTRQPFASRAFQGRSRNGAWGDAVEELDWSLGQLLQRLERLGIAERTLVIWTSDNGAPLRPEPGDLSQGSNQPLHGRGYSTSEGAFRVPMIAWQPGTVPAGQVCDELATTMDILPTFAQLAGADVPQDRELDGRDIGGLLRGDPQARSPHAAFYFYFEDQLQAVRAGRWKLFLPVEPIGPHPHFAAGQPAELLLFDVVSDPGCERNQAAEHADSVAELLQHAERARLELGDRDRPGRAQRPAGHRQAPAEPQRLTNDR